MSTDITSSWSSRILSAAEAVDAAQPARYNGGKINDKTASSVSFQFVVNSYFAEIFNTRSKDVINDCQLYFQLMQFRI